MRRLLAPIVALCLILLPAAYMPPPVPMGPWTTYTPTTSPASGSFGALGTVTGRWQQTGKRVDVAVQVSVTTNGTAGGNTIYIGLPTPVSNSSLATVFMGRKVSNGAAILGFVGPGYTSMVVATLSSTYPVQDGETVTLSGSYEAQ